METACGSIRGLGKTINPTVTTLIGACGLRVIWLYTIFKAVGTIESLYWSYPGLLDANLGHPHRFPADLQAPAGSPTERRKRLCATCLIWTPL